MAMNKEFTDLVQEFLADGYISPRECAVLLKKAEKLGIDVDEAELYIAAQQQKEDIKVALADKKKKGEECPFCGGYVNDLTDKCPHCKKTITPRASEELEKILEALEKALVSFKSDWRNESKNKALVDKYSRKARLYYEHNPKVRMLLEQIDDEVKRAEEAKRLKEKAAEKAKRKKNLSNIIIAIVCFLFAVLVPIALGLFVDAYYEDSSKEPSKEKSVIEQVQMYINDDEISLAESTLSDAMMMEENAYRIFSKYDAICYKIIKYYLDEDDLSAAEDFALEYRAILRNDDKWEDSSCYKLLKTKFKEADRSFNNLKVGWF